METVTSVPKILIIDNSQERATALAQILKTNQYRVAVPLRLQEGLADQVTRVKPDIILIGVDFPGQSILNSIASLHEC